jgi:hypothetical protein
MADPIVFDCGGSTRIKRILANGFGDMPSLLDVHDLSGGSLPGTGPLPPRATGSQQSVRPSDGPFAKMTIMFQDAAGTPFTIPVPALPNSFLIMSNLGQNVRGDFVPVAGEIELIITLFSTVADPLVAAKQLRLDASRQSRRRYIVDNAGPFKTITLNDTPPPVYDATNVSGSAPPIAPRAEGAAGRLAAPAPGLPLYVSVVIS